MAVIINNSIVSFICFALGIAGLFNSNAPTWLSLALIAYAFYGVYRIKEAFDLRRLERQPSTRGDIPPPPS